MKRDEGSYHSNESKKKHMYNWTAILDQRFEINHIRPQDNHYKVDGL